MVAVKYSLEEFIDDMDSLLDKGADQQRIFDEGSGYLERLIRNPEAIPEEYRRPSAKALAPATAVTSSTRERTASPSPPSSGAPATTSAPTTITPGA